MNERNFCPTLSFSSDMGEALAASLDKPHGHLTLAHLNGDNGAQTILDQVPGPLVRELPHLLLPLVA